jgi:hypothetical protein
MEEDGMDTKRKGRRREPTRATFVLTPQLVVEIRQRAARHHRSASGEVRAALERVFAADGTAA